jgi:transposase-like protein
VEAAVAVQEEQLYDWLDGPGLYAWILEELDLDHIPERTIPQYQVRRVRDWGHGALANVYTADRVLVNLGLNLGNVPDELYRPDASHPGTNTGATQETKDAAVAMYMGGANRKEVARRFGIDERTVTAWAARAGLSKRRTGGTGEGHGGAKLTEDNVREIRLAAGLVRQTELARRYGVSPNCIRQIVRGLTWRHVVT